MTAAPALVRGRARAAVGIAAAVITCAAAAGPAAAHHRTSSFSDVDAQDRDVTWRIRVRAADLTGPLVPFGLPDGLSAGDIVARAAAAIGDYVDRRLAVLLDGTPCPSRVVAVAPAADGAPEPAVSFILGYSCPRAGTSPLRLRYELFFDLDPLHQGFAKVATGGDSPATAVFRSGARDLSVTRTPSPWRAVVDYLLLGLEHIFTGYDHLAFLAALLLAVGRGTRRAGGDERPEIRRAVADTVKVVTAFTVAHSITLIHSALRPEALPTGWVEPAIALSVAYVGWENMTARSAVRVRRRWLVVFLFGLIHGLGFASVLQEIGLPARGLIASLVAFNLGVELGQLAVVAVALPAILWFTRRSQVRFQAVALRGGSALIAAAGLLWFALRLGWV